MIIEISGPAIPRLSRAAIEEFVAGVFTAIRRSIPHSRSIDGLSLALVDDDTMRRLNRQFRKKNKTTDVLTFPADDSYSEPGAKHHPLGDIVISLEQARRQAGSEGHSLATEIRYLLLHGILHALGYDHETDDGAMNALELRTRAKVGLV